MSSSKLYSEISLKLHFSFLISSGPPSLEYNKDAPVASAMSIRATNCIKDARVRDRRVLCAALAEKFINSRVRAMKVPLYSARSVYTRHTHTSSSSCTYTLFRRAIFTQSGGLWWLYLIYGSVIHGFFARGLRSFFVPAYMQGRRARWMDRLVIESEMLI